MFCCENPAMAAQRGEGDKELWRGVMRVYDVIPLHNRDKLQDKQRVVDAMSQLPYLDARVLVP